MSSQLGAPPVPLVVVPVSWPHAAKRKPETEKRANPIGRERMSSLKRSQGRQQSVAGLVGIAVPLPSPPIAGQVPGR